MNLSKPITGTSFPETAVLPGAETGMQLGLLAYPANKSQSPALHNRALRQLAHHYPPLRDWRYEAYNVPPEHLASVLYRCHERGVWGLNVSQPHKRSVMPLLAGCDSLTKRIGASNTLVWTPKGYWGTNTDGYGLEKALRTSLGVTLKDSAVLIIGAGGAARAAAFKAVEQGCRHLWLFNRGACNALALQDRLQHYYPDAMVDTWDCESCARIDCIIYAATAPPYAPPPIELSSFRSRPCVYDMRYGTPTSLLLEARRLRLPCSDGLAMLRAQGIASLRYWLKAVSFSPLGAESRFQ